MPPPAFCRAARQSGSQLLDVCACLEMELWRSCLAWSFGAGGREEEQTEKQREPSGGAGPPEGSVLSAMARLQHAAMFSKRVRLACLRVQAQRGQRRSWSVALRPPQQHEGIKQGAARSLRKQPTLQARAQPCCYDVSIFVQSITRRCNALRQPGKAPSNQRTAPRAPLTLSAATPPKHKQTNKNSRSRSTRSRSS